MYVHTSVLRGGLARCTSSTSTRPYVHTYVCMCTCPYYEVAWQGAQAQPQRARMYTCLCTHAYFRVAWQGAQAEPQHAHMYIRMYVHTCVLLGGLAKRARSTSTHPYARAHMHTTKCTDGLRPPCTRNVRVVGVMPPTHAGTWATLTMPLRRHLQNRFPKERIAPHALPHALVNHNNKWSALPHALVSHSGCMCTRCSTWRDR